MKSNKRLQIFFLLQFCLSFVFAQQPCLPAKIDTAALHKALKFEREHRLAPASAPSEVLRVYFHNLCFDDGSNPTATLDQINIEMESLVDNYAPDNICFLYAGLNNINNTSLDTNFDAINDPSSDFDPYQVPGCINVFYMKQIKGKNPSCGNNCGIGGVALGGIPGTYCLISSGNIEKGQTISHEVGHCLGLYHTFEPANGYEDIDGSNSTTSADLIADTHADPYVYDTMKCYALSSNGCTYTGSCTDPKGQSNFSPPYTNIMAYWWTTGCYPVLSFTTDQYTRVNSFLSTNAALESCESPASESISGVSVSSGYYMQSAISVLNTDNTVLFSGTVNATLGGALVLLEPGFDATPSSGGLVLANAESCGVLGMTLTADKNTSELINKDNSLLAYPNPASSSVKLSFNLSSEIKNGVLKVYDMNLRLMKEIPDLDFTKGENTFSLSLTNLSSGMYSVIIQADDLILRTSVVKTN